MDEFGIEIVLMPEGNVDVYKLEWYDGAHGEGWLPATKDHLVGQWTSPERVKRIEGRDVYYEIHIKEWHFSNE